MTKIIVELNEENEAAAGAKSISCGNGNTEIHLAGVDNIVVKRSDGTGYIVIEQGE